MEERKEEKKVLLSAKDVHVQFRVRGRILTAIRGISLDIYEDESIAIVGESGSGKSVFTKTFAGMLDSNGYVSEGVLLFDDDELAETRVPLNDKVKQTVDQMAAKLDEAAKLEPGAATWRKMQALEEEKKARTGLSAAEQQKMNDRITELTDKRTDAFNLKQTFDPKKEKDKIKETSAEIKAYDQELKELEKQKEQMIKAHKSETAADSAYQKEYESKMAALKAQYQKEYESKMAALKAQYQK
ncbi:MAG: ATP-binding cassette domain-containing protein, partial [Lachnospiraceae bacterium]|nr:ATP-binding cassette domain-containing protein [Lachnospiraceae bacterium]